jgi:ketosteroid isomerase-like protein
MRAFTLLLALAALLGLTRPATADIVPPVTSSETEARQVVLAFLENFNAGNAEGIASTYSDRPGFTWIEQGRVAYASKAEAVAGVTAALQTMKGTRMETASEFKMVPVSDKSFLAVVPISIFMAGPDGKEMEVGKSLTTMTLVAEGDGWRILAGHTASDPAPK